VSGLAAFIELIILDPTKSMWGPPATITMVLEKAYFLSVVRLLKFMKINIFK